jgi:diguanylate cyclase (GGDEF)-like protein
MSAAMPFDTRPGRERFLEAVVRSLADPVFILDRDGRYLDAFGGAERREYDSLQYLVGRTMHEVMPTIVADAFLADVRRVITTGLVHVSEYQLSADDCAGNPNDGPDGAQWFQGRIAPVQDYAHGGKPCVAWAIVNISERKRLESELNRLASTDDLTGVLNRRAFLLRTGEWLDALHATHSPRRLQLALIDLDHFKWVNDRYGHLVGDSMLQYVAETLARECDFDKLLARIGGEEFAVAMRETDQARAVRWLDDMRMLFREHPFRMGGESIPVAFSAGVAGAGPEDRHPTDLLRHADLWLYSAKDAGRDRVAYPGWVNRRTR